MQPWTTSAVKQGPHENYWLDQAKYYFHMSQTYLGEYWEERMWECLLSHYWRDEDE